MPYIVVVKHQSKGTLRVPTDVANKENAIAQAQMRNRGSGYDWENATVEDFVPGLAKKNFRLEYESGKWRLFSNTTDQFERANGLLFAPDWTDSIMEGESRRDVLIFRDGKADSSVVLQRLRDAGILTEEIEVKAKS